MQKVEVYFVSQESEIHKILNKIPASSKYKGIYINFSGIKINDEKLKNFQFKEFDLIDYIYRNSNIFLRKYIDIISKFSKKFNSRYWWATEIASKNRFTNKYIQSIFHYYLSNKIIKSKKYQKIIFIGLNYGPKLCLSDNKENIFLKNNFHIFLSKITCKLIWSRNQLSIFKCFLRILIRSTIARLLLNHKNLLQNRKYILIKTHIYRNSFNDKGMFNDLFFGPLPRYLKKKNQIIYIAHIHDNYIKNLKNLKRNDKQIIFPYEYFLNINDIVYSFVKLFLQKFKYNLDFKELHFQNLNIKKLSKIEINLTKFDFNHWIMFESTKNLVFKYQIKKSILTYENIAWENMFILALKKYSPGTKIIGYQHTVVPKAAAGMFSNRHEIKLKPLPDKILTTGIINKKTILKFSDYKKNFVSSACALRFQHLKKTRVKRRKKIKRILIVLEANTEMKYLVNYLLLQVSNLQKLKFIIRPHPMLSLANILKKTDYPIINNENVSISSNSLLNDLKSSDLCIYWGSTVSIEAIKMGIPIVHYRTNSILDYDPLYNFHHLKWTINYKSDLKKTIEKIDTIKSKYYKSLIGKSNIFLNKYFLKINNNNIKKFLN